MVGLLGERGTRLEVGPPPPDVPVVVPQVPHGLAELRDVAQLVERVTGVRGQRAEQVRPQHRGDHRAEPAAGLAHDRPVRGRVQRPVVRVHPGHHLVAQVGVVLAGARRVHELAAAVAGSTRPRRPRSRRAPARMRTPRRPSPGTAAGTATGSATWRCARCSPGSRTPRGSGGQGPRRSRAAGRPTAAARAGSPSGLPRSSSTVDHVLVDTPRQVSGPGQHRASSLVQVLGRAGTYRRGMSIEQAERDPVELHFAEMAATLNGQSPAPAGPPDGPAVWTRGSAPIRPGSALTGQQCLELFDAQLASRHLDVAARWLRARGAGYYTIGSSGHEGNAGVAAALRLTDPALLHYRSGRVLPGPRAAGQPAAGRRARRAARPGGGGGRADRRRPAQGVRPPGAERDPADLDDRLAPAAGASGWPSPWSGRPGWASRRGLAGRRDRGWPASATRR